MISSPPLPRSLLQLPIILISTPFSTAPRPPKQTTFLPNPPRQRPRNSPACCLNLLLPHFPLRHPQRQRSPTRSHRLRVQYLLPKPSFTRRSRPNRPLPTLATICLVRPLLMVITLIPRLVLQPLVLMAIMVVSIPTLWPLPRIVSTPQIHTIRLCHLRRRPFRLASLGLTVMFRQLRQATALEICRTSSRPNLSNRPNININNSPLKV